MMMLYRFTMRLGQNLLSSAVSSLMHILDLTVPNGNMPLHYACFKGSLSTVEFLYEIYPDAIKHAAVNGQFPIHIAIASTTYRVNPATAFEIVQFLLDCDPHQTILSLLHFASRQQYNDSNIEAGKIVKTLFDALPEAIEDDRIAPNIHRYHQQVQEFINGELVYARQAKDHRLMHTPDGNGRLPLHKALQNSVRLGSIKLLVKGNPSAIRTFDKNGVIHLHVASQYNNACVVGYIVSLADETLDTTDRQGNTALHYACLGAKYETISLLLEKYDAVSVSRRNARKKLPIDLLWESNAVEDRESLEYTGSVFQLMRANPQMVQSVIR